MTTFTQLVTDIVDELLRPDKRAAICTYTNQTVREIHFKPSITAPIRFDENRFEDVIAVNTAAPFIWNLPTPALFQEVEALYCVELGIYIERRNPKITREFTFAPNANVYWYRSGSYIAIAGLSSGMTIQASWYQYPRSLADQTLVTPKVTWSVANQIYTMEPGAGVPTQPQLDAATHWMLTRWEDCIKQGVRAKVFSGMGDGDRARMMFSAFENLRAGLWEAEPSS